MQVKVGDITFSIAVNIFSILWLFSRMKDTEKKKTFLPTFKKNERDRKKLMDMVLKQLKALVAGPQTSKVPALKL